MEAVQEKNMTILTIDTTGASASVSILNEKREFYAQLSSDTMSHLQMLIPMTERVIEQAGISKTDITHIGAAVGPGSFTGIRIGLATAKTLAQAWNLSMIAVSSLAAFSYAIREPKSMICPMIDARHGQVFCGAFLSVYDEEIQRAEPEILKAEDVRPAEEFIEAAVLEAIRSSEIDHVYFCGDGAGRYSEKIQAAAKSAAESGVKVIAAAPREAHEEQEASNRKEETELPVLSAYRRAEATARMAFRMAEAGLTVTYDEIEPVYLRKSEAERKLEAKELGKKKKASEKEEVIFEMPPADEQISYRRADEQDAAAFARLDSLCFKSAWKESSFHGELDSGKNAVYIAAENSKKEVIGFAGAAFVLDEGEVNRVAVHPLYRGRGIADRMMTMLCEAAESFGVVSLFLEVREANRSAIALYKNHGFCVMGKREGYYAETGENALLMNWKSAWSAGPSE